MRFIADGPSIPDELLLARDQGRVIFFCGAGVSRARANLPDFFGLAKKVIAKLGVVSESPAFKLIREAQEIDQRVGITGVISADRVFGLLERDFLSRDIEEAVASALKPPSDCDLRAHNTLLDLATTPEGAVRLVTTNFDRLFDDCGRNLQSWQPPRLPDPLRPNDINGIVYLHGRATPEYTGAEGDGFILSSSEFGRAYLSDGWATVFIREILERYVVVFVGYTADDPPVQYLLEALRKKSGKLENAYAFQSGDHDDAAARWRHKGVRAIPYNSDNSHAALWLTLEAWAERARDPDAWQSKVIELAKKGPEILQPYERGQVAHIVSTYEGIKKFCQGDNPPSAEWLCVFDPHRRFAKPKHSGSFGQIGPYVDPFDLYGLDSDISPRKLDPDDHYAKREIPSGAWDAFALNRLDLTPLSDENLSSLRGQWASHPPRLAPRVEQIGIWIAQVCGQPAAVWWAAHQLSLHRSIQERIKWSLERSEKTIHPQIRQVWRFLFEAWRQGKNDSYREWFHLQKVVKEEGWSNSVVRQFCEVFRPYFSAGPNVWGGSKSPPASAELRIGDLIEIDVKYPEQHEKMSIPDEWCAAVTKVLRQNLELALSLETDIGGYGLDNIASLNHDDTHQEDRYGHTHGLSAAVVKFSELFSQLVEADRHAAQQELLAWPLTDDTIFARLRIWAAGKEKVVPARDFKRVIMKLSDAAFWNAHHQRDLLLVLAHRWAELSAAARRTIERRLVAGPKRWKREKNSKFEERRAWSILSRVHWLANYGCVFSFEIEEIMDTLRSIAPNWKPEYGAKAAESLEGKGGWVKSETSHEALLGTPLSSILSRAKDLSGRSEDFLVEYDPFVGLAEKYPRRAFSALTYAAKRGEFPEWAWQRFLSSEARKNDKAKFAGLIAERLSSYPAAQIASFIRPASEWLRDASATLASSYISSFDKITQKLISILRAQPDQGRSSIVRGSKEPDWTMEAINSPTGRIAEAMFRDPRIKNVNADQGFPQPWLNHVEALLTLPDDLRRHALVIIFHNLNWLYYIHPTWTERNLLSVFNGGDIYDRDAAWSGFLWGARTPNRGLYMRLKEQLLAFSTNLLPSRRSYVNIIADMLLAGWGSIEEETGERCISNDEMRTLLLNVDDALRSQILLQAGRWTSGGDNIWKDLLPELLRIWPRQISAKSPNISAQLCELAFADPERFPLLVELTLPLLTKIERDHLMLPELRSSNDNIVDRYPTQTLAILYAALPENALAWPYGIEETLQRIGEADKALSSDERLIALKRRWDAR